MANHTGRSEVCKNNENALAARPHLAELLRKRSRKREEDGSKEGGGEEVQY